MPSNKTAPCKGLANAGVEEGVVVEHISHFKTFLGELVIKAPRCAQSVEPGQFVHVQLPGLEAHLLRRPFSVYKTDPDAGTLTLLYQAVGAGTFFMTTLTEGSTLGLIGPLGRGWEPKQAQSLLLVGGGVGVAPLFLLAKEARSRGCLVSAVLGAATAKMLVYEEDYARLVGAESLFITTDDGSRGHHGLSTELAGELMDVRDFDYIATCGPEPMQKKVAQLAQAANIPVQVSLERRMACGIGACLGCIVETTQGKQRACVDGPVFDGEEVLW